jgi:hypothetical protein
VYGLHRKGTKIKCNIIIRCVCSHFDPEDGRSKLLLNVDIQLRIIWCHNPEEYSLNTAVTVLSDLIKVISQGVSD